jgi:integrase
MLNELHEFSGDGEYIFPSSHQKSKHVHIATFRTALQSMGFDSKLITPHGFRGTASTYLNTKGYRTDAIEAQLSHKDTNNVRAAYNHSDYMEERRLMLQEWADYLDSLKSLYSLN